MLKVDVSLTSSRMIVNHDSITDVMDHLIFANVIQCFFELLNETFFYLLKHQFESKVYEERKGSSLSVWAKPLIEKKTGSSIYFCPFNPLTQ